jgi:hypothetical protein
MTIAGFSLDAYGVLHFSDDGDDGDDGDDAR